ncbi:MAG: glycosyltransferase family 2 protein [Candidatus Blackburnbacteria bacterium]|nr:glycosyltransferase family 2 protein [Candidatus Blackburnbacteria bacterium]
MKTNVSVIIIAKNAADKIGDAIDSAKGLTSDVVVLEGGSVDQTVMVSKSHNARVVKQTGKNFSEWRNQGMEISKAPWVLYLDHDERLIPELKTEVEKQIEGSKFVAYAIPRRNFILGREFKHGGEWPDYQQRLFFRERFKRWEKELHEEPRFEGKLGYLKSPLIHLKHDSISEMVEKTNNWSEVEAKLLFGAKHPRMSWWRFIRIMLMELWDRLILKKGILDGGEGVVYSLYQMWSRYLTYAKLWEIQQGGGR